MNFVNRGAVVAIIQMPLRKHPDMDDELRPCDETT